MNKDTPRLRMFAGPNGSGKSTFKKLIRQELLGVYINPDEIEKEICDRGFAAKLKEILSQEKKEGWRVKFADIPAACGAGFEYVLEPCFQPDPADKTFYSRGIEISVPSACIKRLLGSLIDFEEGFIDENFTGLIKLGFTIANPNAKSTCDCGCSTGYGA